MNIHCERCGTTFDVPPSTARKGRRYCSRACFSPPFDVAVWDRLDIGDCWVWTGPTDREGYGKVAAERGGLIHRAVWILLVGPIPDGLTLDHLCRNPPCANPDHLEPVDTRTNVLRGYGTGAKFARRSHCSHGHPLTGPAADVTTTKGRGRRCNPCNRENARRWRERNAA